MPQRPGQTNASDESHTNESAPRVSCPACGKPAIYAASNPARPFCSERCRLIDLGAWASESYRIPEQTPPDGGLAAGSPHDQD